VPWRCELMAAPEAGPLFYGWRQADSPSWIRRLCWVATWLGSQAETGP